MSFEDRTKIKPKHIEHHKQVCHSFSLWAHKVGTGIFPLPCYVDWCQRNTCQRSCCILSRCPQLRIFTLRKVLTWSICGPGHADKLETMEQHGSMSSKSRQIGSLKTNYGDCLGLKPSLKIKSAQFDKMKQLLCLLC